MIIFIRKYFNSFGIGFEFRSDDGHKTYYGYTKNQAKKKFREDFGLKYKHLDFIEL